MYKNKQLGIDIDKEEAVSILVLMDLCIKTNPSANIHIAIA